ncbi:indolepyruvate ferredoxin oxidoreductase family protein [Jatrophihabitans endophyticus]|uniref:indolepyruvate ferredoxin oxidoreductase family protein n=1 Tax=Jatrophihabitans endophyticus TaxID=1206085 RepID=UPI00190EA531|nr:indolepyruvate ferredoxin oxidoreductase family protein [Jatrophihabitans endophyticus]
MSSPAKPDQARRDDTVATTGGATGGATPPPFSLDDRFAVVEGEVYLTGVQALVRVLLDQRRRDARLGLRTAGFVSGYPGSPLGGVDLELNRRAALLAEHDIRHQPGLNEDLAATAIWGAQTAGTLPAPLYDGVFGMWYGKSPGVDRTGDAFRHGNIGGVAEYGGVLAVAGDDPDARSTNFPTDTNGAFHDWAMPILFPGTMQDVIDLGLHGYALSRAAGVWVAFKMVTDIADGSGTAHVGPDRVDPIVPSVTLDGRPFRPQLRVGTPGPPMREAERDLFSARTELAARYVELNGLNPVVVDPPDARIGIVAPGKAYTDLREALTTLGLDHDDLVRAGVRIKKVSALSPVAASEWRAFAAGLQEIVVVEEKRPFLERFLRDALYGQPAAPAIVGKRDERDEAFLPISGELTAALVARVLGPRLHDRWGLDVRLPQVARERTLLPLSTARTPYFCSGCPHNRSLVVPEGSLVGSGIGCHILQLVVPRPEYGELVGFTQMGAEGAQWVGASAYTEAEHIFQNIGDGTFHHSGSLGLRFAVASKANITYKLLYNSAVGMTGGQDVEGAMTVPAIAALLEAEGVVRTIITTDDPKKYRRTKLPKNASVRHRDDLVEAQEELAALTGVTVLIHDQQCAAEKRRLRKRAKQAEPTTRIMINDRVCEGCGDCNSKSQCLSVQPLETEFGRKTTIHQSSCNLDYSCANGDCPSFVSVDVENAKKAGTAVRLPSVPLVDPVAVVPTDAVNIHMTGIGGTGVVTTSQIMATAAVLDGHQVRNLDLTGSSQKAGPVVSQLQLFTGDVEPATTIPAGGADVFLAFDLLASVSEPNLAKGDPQRTVVVASSSVAPTGQMAYNSAIPLPSVAELRTMLDGVSRATENVYVDAEALARAVFGTHMVANSILIGAAHQAGALPLSTSSLEQAIRLNGTAVDKNLAAFAWGRAAVLDPAGTAEVVAKAKAAAARQVAVDERAAALAGGVEGVDDELRRLLTVRVADLIGFQNERYARRYLRVVRAAVDAERRVAGAPGDLARAVAAGLHKLMAYKDEYEVARLHLLDSAQDAVVTEFGEGAVASLLLHPPALRALGMKRKIKLGPRYTPVMRGLRGMKAVRGTPLDVFGYAEVRRVERALVQQYTAMIESGLRGLTAERLPALTELAAAPQDVRGYEHIKLRNVAAYVDRVRTLSAAAGADPSLGDGPLTRLSARPAEQPG